MKNLYFWSQFFEGQIAQSVEQRTENPCVGGSIPSLPTSVCEYNRVFALFVLKRTDTFLID